MSLVNWGEIVLIIPEMERMPQCVGSTHWFKTLFLVQIFNSVWAPKLKLMIFQKKVLKMDFSGLKIGFCLSVYNYLLKGPSCYHQNMLSCWTWHFLGRLRWTNPYLAVVAFTQKAITILSSSKIRKRTKVRSFSTFFELYFISGYFQIILNSVNHERKRVK